MPRYVDIHSHLFFKDYDKDLDEVLQRCEDDEIAAITVGTNYETSLEAVQLAESKSYLYATLGVHPTHADEETFSETAYRELAQHPKIVGIGECGLDYFRRDGTDKEVKKVQMREFEKQIDFAIRYDLPMMIHARPSKGTMDAYLDVASVIASKQKSAGEKLHGNMHFFVGSVEIARRFYELGFSTSFTGVLTFTHDYDDVVRFAPLDMIMTETDAPFAAPTPYRGRRNEPSYVKYVVEAISRVRGEDKDAVRGALVQNAERLFRLK